MPHLQVTGYFVPTLYQWSETALARTCMRWLTSIQLPDGAFPAPDGIPYTFDRAQVMSGLRAAYTHGELVEEALLRAADWMVTQIASDARLGRPSTELWGDIANDLVHTMQSIHSCRSASRWNGLDTGKPGSLVLSYYNMHDGSVPFNRWSHFRAYAMQALWEFNERGMARRRMAEVERFQREDGSVHAYLDVEWICSAGIAQYAFARYRLGNRERADRTSCSSLIELIGFRIDHDLNLMRENQALEYLTVVVFEEVGKILREGDFDYVFVQGARPLRWPLASPRSITGGYQSDTSRPG